MLFILSHILRKGLPMNLMPDWVSERRYSHDFIERLRQHFFFLKDDKSGCRFEVKIDELLPRNLSDLNLKKACLIGANLFNSICNRTHLEGSDLSFAIAICAEMNEAKLGGAHLEYINLKCAILRAAKLRGATMA